MTPFKQLLYLEREANNLQNHIDHAAVQIRRHGDMKRITDIVDILKEAKSEMEDVLFEIKLARAVEKKGRTIKKAKP